MDRTSKIFVAGHRGLAGSAIVRRLVSDGYQNILTVSHDELDLCDERAVEEFFESHRPEYVFLAAAKVGGILANSSFPVDFMVDNLRIQMSVLRQAHKYSARKLMFLGSSCIYPKFAKQPIVEEELLSGFLEPTNEAYAIAKISGIKLCEYMNRQHGTEFMSVMPTNLYGPNDNFDLETSHVLPALLRKFHEAKVLGKSEVVVWGSGTPKREFLHVDDLANAVVYLMQNFKQSDIGGYVNVGTGQDIAVCDLAFLIGSVVGYEGEIVFDTSKPDGTPRKVLDISRLRDLGWEPTIALPDGIRRTYEWALSSGYLTNGL